MKKNFSIICFFLCVLLFTKASNYSIQQWIYTGTFEKAKLALDKSIAKDDSNYITNYLLAQYYFDARNKVYDVDSAYHFINASINYLPAQSDKKYLKQVKYGFSEEKLLSLQKQIISEAYLAAEEKNNIDAYAHFLQTYKSPYYESLAIKHRNDLAFGQAKEKMDFMSFKEFMEKYPDANQAAEAKQLYQKLLFEHTQANGTWQAYKEYLDQYPETPYTAQAQLAYETKLFEAYTETADASKYYEFISKYPTNRFRTEAEKKLFDLSCLNYDTKTLLSFVQTYPLSALLPKIKQMLYLQETADDQDSSYAAFERAFPEWIPATSFARDRALSKLDYESFEEANKYGFKNTHNDSLVQAAVYYDAQDFVGRRCAVAVQAAQKNKFKYGFINKDFQLVIPAVYDDVYDFENGFVIVGVGDCPDGACAYGMLNENGDTIIPLVYSNLHPLKEGLALAENQEGKIGYLNNAGRWIIEPQYKMARNFCEGRAAVFVDTAWIYIDSTGKQAFPLNEFALTDFKDGFASFSHNGSIWGLINKAGKVIVEPRFLEPIAFEGDYTIVRSEDKIEKKGKVKFVLNHYKLFKDGHLEPIKIN